MSTRVVDSHLHVWDLGVSRYGWLGPQHGPLHRSFLPAEAERVLAEAGIASAVLIQAEDSERDTEYLLSVAESFSFAAAVVGWVQLDDPDVAAEQLSRLVGRGAFRGVRHLVHDDPRADLLEQAGVRRSLALLAEAGLPFDVPDAWPRHLGQLRSLADALPGLTVVVDHCAKPPRGTPEMEAWSAALAAVAERPNTVAKLSGLQVTGQPFTADALSSVWETALGCFGPSRLMYGGDWPMTVPAGGYLAHYRVVMSLVAELSPAEQAEVLEGTARRVYRIEGPEDA